MPPSGPEAGGRWARRQEQPRAAWAADPGGPAVPRRCDRDPPWCRSARARGSERRRGAVDPGGPEAARRWARRQEQARAADSAVPAVRRRCDRDPPWCRSARARASERRRGAVDPGGPEAARRWARRQEQARAADPAGRRFVGDAIAILRGAARLGLGRPSAGAARSIQADRRRGGAGLVDRSRRGRLRRRIRAGSCRRFVHTIVILNDAAQARARGCERRGAVDPGSGSPPSDQSSAPPSGPPARPR